MNKRKTNKNKTNRNTVRNKTSASLKYPKTEKKKILPEGLLGNKNKPLPTDKAMRLSKVAIELNVGISTIASYLELNGFNIDQSPNTKLAPELIEIINGNPSHLDKPFISDYTYKLIDDLKIDYDIIFKISPEQFELLVANLLDRRGFKVQINGKTNTKDGGIDIIAYRKDIILIVIAIQVKFKTRPEKKVNAGEVRDFKGALSLNDYFSAGILITNTDFTVDARWIENQLNAKMELKDSEDIQMWLRDNFTTKKNLRMEVDIAKDVNIKI